MKLRYERRNRAAKFQCIVCSVALTTVLIACGRASVEEGARTVQHMPAVECLPDFKAFLIRFTDDQNYQRMFVHYPYMVTRYDPQNLEADPVTESYQSGNLTFPVMPTSQAMQNQGIKVEVKKTAPDAYHVSTYQSGSDAFSSSFDFEKQGECWYLVHSTE